MHLKKGGRMETGKRFLLRALKATTLLWSLVIALACTGVAQAGPQYTLTCVFCHRMAPLDAEPGTKDPSIGAFSGSHQAHANNSRSSCAKCHNDGVNRVE